MDDNEILARLNRYDKIYNDNEYIIESDSDADQAQTIGIAGAGAVSSPPQEKTVDATSILLGLVAMIKNEEVDFCVSYFNDDDFYIVTDVDGLFCSNCIFQLVMNVQFPTCDECSISKTKKKESVTFLYA
ncbi:hypothetical protein CL622_04220 [archaeon]|nr:hypothetical protein [archaeon]|tara:strand:- start:2265 stop:2654 length:390 start_codon:yes stop_codon:yes gene_type:complete